MCNSILLYPLIHTASYVIDILCCQEQDYLVVQVYYADMFFYKCRENILQILQSNISFLKSYKPSLNLIITNNNNISTNNN